MKNLHKTIRRYREDKGISRQEIADLLGMTLNGYGKIERGEVEVTISRLYEIAGILQMPIAHFLDDNMPQRENSDSARKSNDREKSSSEFEGNFDPFVYIEFLEGRINYLKAQLNHSQQS